MGHSYILMRSWYDDTPTSPFVNKEKHCAFKRPSYTGIPVLNGPCNCCMGAACQLSSISSHFRTEFHYSPCVYSFYPFFPERTKFSHSNVFFGPGSFSFWLVVYPLHHLMMLYCLSACLLHHDWHHWILLKVLVGLSWLLFWQLIAF